MGERGPAFKIAEGGATRLPASHGRPILQAMKRTFKALKPTAAKAKRQPAAAERKPGGKQPAPEDLDRAAQQKAAERQTPTTDREKADEAKEVGGPEGPEPTRYGDWERGGICYDF
jgi:hypothetical protein